MAVSVGGKTERRRSEQLTLPSIRTDPSATHVVGGSFHFVSVPDELRPFARAFFYRLRHTGIPWEDKRDLLQNGLYILVKKMPKADWAKARAVGAFGQRAARILLYRYFAAKQSLREYNTEPETMESTPDRDSTTKRVADHHRPRDDVLIRKMARHVIPVLYGRRVKRLTPKQLQNTYQLRKAGIEGRYRREKKKFLRLVLHLGVCRQPPDKCQKCADTGLESCEVEQLKEALERRIDALDVSLEELA